MKKFSQIPEQKRDSRRARKTHWKELVRSNRELERAGTRDHIPPAQLFGRN